MKTEEKAGKKVYLLWINDSGGLCIYDVPFGIFSSELEAKNVIEHFKHGDYGFRWAIKEVILDEWHKLEKGGYGIDINSIEDYDWRKTND